jgi:hypothetical protein
MAAPTSGRRKVGVAKTPKEQKEERQGERQSAVHSHSRARMHLLTVKLVDAPDSSVMD